MSDVFLKTANISEADAIARLLSQTSIDASLRKRMSERAVELVQRIREDSEPGMMELFWESMAYPAKKAWRSCVWRKPCSGYQTVTRWML